MSTTEDQGPVKATVIDLDPDQVVDEDAPKSEAVATPTAKAQPSRRPVIPFALALLAGIGLGTWFYRDVLSSYWPTDEVSQLQGKIADLEKARSDADGTIKRLAESSQNLAQDVTGLRAKLSALEPKQTELEQSLSSQSSRLTALEETQKKLRADLETLANAPAQPNGVATAAVPADLLLRLETVEKDLASLKAGLSTRPDTTALSQSLSDLKAKIEAGVSFKSEYERLSRFVPAAAGLETLSLYADQGLPDAKGLARELAALTPSLPRPDALPPASAEKSWFDRFTEALGSVIIIRETGVVDWQAVGGKAQVFADAGDLAQAITTIDAAEGAKPVALQHWRDRAAQRILLEAALAEASQSVMRELAARQ